MVNKRTIILLLLVLAIVTIPLFMYNHNGNQTSFGGSDDQASAYLESQGYQSWFHSLWEPGSQMEDLLFIITGCLGVVVMVFILKYLGKTKAKMGK